MSLSSSIWANSPQASEKGSERTSKGLESSRWATADSSNTKTTSEKSSRRGQSEKAQRQGKSRRASGGNDHGKVERENVKQKTHNVNELAARLGMLEVGASPKKVRQQDTHSKKKRTSSHSSQKGPNPLAARLGMVDHGESSEENDSEDTSRPSTSSKNSIFDRIKPAKSTSKPAGVQAHTNAAPKSNAKSSSKQLLKSDVLKKKIEEQRKIREANQHKAQQTELLQDFLNGDSFTDWKEEL